MLTNAYGAFADVDERVLARDFFWEWTLTLSLTLYGRVKKDTMSTSEDAAPSSPTPAVFSDQATRSASPPSSPPGFPWENKSHEPAKTTNPLAMKTSAFSVLGKRKALESISDNVRVAKKVATRRVDVGSLTQMQISLGQKVQEKCKTCGMEYMLSSAEDRKLHDKHHQVIVEGYDVGKDFHTKSRRPSARQVWRGMATLDYICAVDCFDKWPLRRKAQTVLEVVQRDLGAVELSKDELWDAKSLVNDATSLTSKYRSYLYIRGTKCIGYLLAQNIEGAYRAVEPSPALKRGVGEHTKQTGASDALKARQRATAEQLKQPLQLSQGLSTAKLGIARIWCSPTHRRDDIATSLLDNMLEDYCQRVGDPEYIACFLHKLSKLPQNEGSTPGDQYETIRENAKGVVAFSQPTEAGIALARKWFGKDYGWGVYID